MSLLGPLCPRYEGQLTIRRAGLTHQSALSNPRVHFSSMQTDWLVMDRNEWRTRRVVHHYHPPPHALDSYVIIGLVHLSKYLRLFIIVPIVINLERRCAKFIWSCLNSDNSIVKTIANSAKCSSVSNFGDNYRYLSYKYKIVNHVWDSPLSKLHKCFDSYMHSIAVFPQGSFIRIIV